MLDTPAFESLAADSLVLLEVDLPQNSALDATLRAEAHPQNRPGILRARVQYGMAVAQTVEDLEQVRRQLKELIPQLPPDEAASEQHLLDHFFQDLPALLNTLKHSRQGY